jgi:NAD+ kinase
MIKKVAIVVKEDLREALKVAKEIKRYLTSKDIEICFDETSAKRLNLEEMGCKLKEIRADLMLVLGGDGTILWIEQKISGKQIPIFGINFGTTGFLTEIRPKEWKNALEKILEGEYSIDERTKLKVKVNDEIVGEALNEAVVMTSIPVKMLYLEIKVDDQIAEVVRSDGIIISTPTGSTAYSMSAGGPIVDPEVEAFVITSICPFKLRARSLVVPQDSIIKVRLIRPKKEAIVIVDGAIKKTLKYKNEASFELSKSKAYFVKLERDFYGRIKERLEG